MSICAGLLRPPTRGVAVEAEPEGQSRFRNIMGGSDCGKGCATNAKLRLRLEFMVELGVSICFSVIDMTYEIFRIGHAAYLHLIGLENSIV